MGFSPELRRLQLISVAKRLLALWKSDNAPSSSVNDAAYQSLQDELYRHSISMADSYFLSLWAAQGFMLTYLDAAREGKQSLKGLSWDKAYQLLQGTLDSLEHHRPIDDADLLRVTGLKTWKKQPPKQKRNNKGTAA